MRTGNIIITRNPRITAYEIAVDNGFVGTEQQWLASIGKTYKVYKALLTQSGTDAPVATVLENTLGNITYTYDNSGAYYINSSSLFNLNKTFIIIGNTANVSNEPCIIYTDQVGVNQILLQTYNIPQVAFENFILNETPILIEVYP